MIILKIARGFVFSNFFIATCAVALKYFFYPQTTAQELLVNFFSVLAAYNFLRMEDTFQTVNSTDSSIKTLKSLNHSFQKKVIVGALLGLGCCLFCFFPFVPLHWMLCAAILPLYFYFRKIYFFNDIPSLAQAFIKIGIVALVWSIMLMPAILEKGSIFVLLGVFCFIMALMVPFEIKDMASDSQSEVSTLPLILGIRKSKIIAYLFLFIALCSFYIHFSFELHFIALFITLTLTSFFVFSSSSMKPDMFYYVYVDGLMLLPLIVQTMFSHFHLLYYSQL